VAKGKLTQEHQRLASNSNKGNNTQHALSSHNNKHKCQYFLCQPIPTIINMEDSINHHFIQQIHQLALKWLMCMQKMTTKSQLKNSGTSVLQEHCTCNF